MFLVDEVLLGVVIIGKLVVIPFTISTSEFASLAGFEEPISVLSSIRFSLSLETS